MKSKNVNAKCPKTIAESLSGSRQCRVTWKHTHDILSPNCWLKPSKCCQVESRVDWIHPGFPVTSHHITSLTTTHMLQWKVNL